jgi:hypothetical protein
MVQMVVELKEMVYVTQGIVGTTGAVTGGRDGSISFNVLFIARVDELEPIFTL